MKLNISERDDYTKAAIELMKFNEQFQDDPLLGIFWYSVHEDELFGVTSSMAEDNAWRPSQQFNAIIRTDKRLHQDVWKKQHCQLLTRLKPRNKEPPFMNILRRRIFVQYPSAVITYGSETTPKRKQMQLDKTHYNDAIIISGITNIKECPNEWLLIKQFRKKKRSLHEATARKGRKEPNRTQKRNSKNTPYYKGFYLNDRVSTLGKVGYITGFTSSGVYIKNQNDEYITLPNKTYKQVGIANVKLVNHNNNWQYFSQVG